MTSPLSFRAPVKHFFDAVIADLVEDPRSRKEAERSDLQHYITRIDDLPPIRVDGMRMLDGLHRVAAARLLGRLTIRACRET